VVFNISTVSTGMSAVNVLGKTTLSSSSAVSRQQALISSNHGLALTDNGNRLFVVDHASANRVLIFDVGP
jgi:hypothetical protein